MIDLNEESLNSGFVDTTSHLQGERLEIHIIGGRKGESIVVRLPPESSDDPPKWGVIDCYAARLDRPEDNPTCNFLKSRKVTELAFLCLTHPHDDHYRGMSHLVHEFEIREFWQFNIDWNMMAGFVEMLHFLTQSPNRKNERESLDDLFEALKGVRHKTVVKRYLTANTYLFPMPQGTPSVTPHVEIYGITPSAASQQRYLAPFNTWLKSSDKGIIPLPRLKHNEISGALLLTYGDTTIVLGADSEGNEWREVLANWNSDKLQANSVKVSHHGSKNGYCERLWSTFAGGKSRHEVEGFDRKLLFAVICPFKRFGLPRAEAILHIKEYADEILVASRPAIPFVDWVGRTPYEIWGELNTDFFDTLSPEHKFFISECFGLVVGDENDNDYGICSIYFDSRGNVIHKELSGSAGCLWSRESDDDSDARNTL